MSVIAVAPDERILAGRVSGLLYLLGGITMAVFIVLPGVTVHPLGLVLTGGLACAWGAISLTLIRWESAPPWLIGLSSAWGFVIIAAAVASTGGAESPAWVYLFFDGLFAAYFYRPRVVAVYLLACGVVHALPLLYQSAAARSDFTGQLLVACAAYLSLGGTIVAGKSLIVAMRVRAERLAAEQGALRRIATAVVGAERPEQIYQLVSDEAAALVGASGAGILRQEREGEMVVMGSSADEPRGRYLPGARVPVHPGSDMATAIATGLPVRIDEHEAGSPVDALGYRSTIVAPIRVAGAVWGLLAVATKDAHGLTFSHEEVLMEFCDLLATAITNIEHREKLAAQASSDPLTRLANHRTLQQRLAAEASLAERHDMPLSVAVIDIDHFKQINDIGGHEAGDEMLGRVAACLRKLARAGDTLGRVGGDEFAWVLPQTGREQALIAVERARRVIAGAVPQPYRVTVSAGICDNRVTADPVELIRYADGALYWSKARGRDQCWIYDPQVVNELSAQERAERLERSQALLGLRALARAIDAKDPATREHSERVSRLVGKLARTAGWSPERSLLLSEAALVHDVGKIGVPDTTLRKTTPLSPDERAQIADHADLSARIVDGVLAPEQVDWVRTHHERPDGLGYPDGLTEEEIPEGAALMAVADAFDVMTVSRPYSHPKTLEAAVAECQSLVSQQFTRHAVEALMRLHESGELAGLVPHERVELAGQPG